MSYVGSSFISQPVQDELDGKVSLVSATTQSIGSALDVSGNINLTAGSEFQINGVPIGGGGSNLPTIDTLFVDGSIENFSQTDITYIIGSVISAHIALNNFYDFPAGKTKTIIAEELNGKLVLILTDGGIALSPGLSKNGQQQTFLWDGTKWTYDDNKITTRLVGWGTTPLTPPNSNTTIQSELQESGDINLLTGKKYKINAVNLEAVAETLSNKTISGSSNTILNLPISSTTGLQTALDGKVALVSATKQTIGSALDVSGNINLPTGSQYQINGVSITAGGGGGGTPGGVEGSVQYNASGAFAGESDFNYSASTNTLTLTNGTLRPSAINFNSDKIAITGNTTTTNQKSRAVAIGAEAGQTNQNVEAIAIGGGAGLLNQGIQAIAIGQSAGTAYQNSQAIAIGFSAGNEGQGFGSIAIGNFSGISYQGEKSIAIGSGAGGYSQARDSIAIGSSTLNSARYSICINATGDTLGAFNENSLVVAPIRTENDLTGLNSLFYNTISKEIVVSGTEGGGTLRPEFINFSSDKVRIGGNNDANFQNQESACIAIGYNAGLNNQATAGVAIGFHAGYSSQGQGAVALGWNAGHLFQGQNSVAIGNQAGKAFQYPNSICINATGNDLVTPGNDTCVIKPIRNETNISGFLQLYYNPTTGELVYN